MGEEPKQEDVTSFRGIDKAPSWRRRASRTIAYGILVVSTVGLGILIWWSVEGSEDVGYTTEEVQRGLLIVTVTVTGTVKPTNEVEISSELSGII